MDDYYTKDILLELKSIDCDNKCYKKAEDILLNFKYNTGFTYTNPNKHITMIIIGLSSTTEEFVNTYNHEKGHAAIHISQYYDIDPYSETFQYLQGKLGEEMFKVSKNLICTKYFN